MKKNIQRIIRSIVLLFTLCVISLYIRGQGKDDLTKIISTEKVVPEFQSISIDENFNVFIVEGSAQKIIIEATEKYINNIVSNVVNGCLYVFCYHKSKKGTLMNVFVTVKELNKITVSGIANVKLLSKFRKLDLYMETSASALKLGVSASDFNFNVYGKGKVNIEGNFTVLGCTIHDEADLNLDITSDKLSCNASDMAVVKLSGLCNEFSICLKDEASIQSSAFITKKCKINITDSGEAYVSVLENLEINGSQDGFVEYRGEPALQIEAPKTVSIKYKKDKIFANGQ